MPKKRMNLTVETETYDHLKELAGGERMIGRFLDMLVAKEWKVIKDDTVESRLREEILQLSRGVDFYLGQLKDRVQHIEDHLGGVKRD